MLNTIIRKEFLEVTRDGRFRAAAVTVVLLLFAALASGARYHAALKTERERAASVQREQWVTQGEKGPHAAAHFGVWAFKPAQPLALFDRGVEAYTGAAVWVEAHKQNDFKFLPAQDATALQRFGELTAATVLQLLAPLLIIALSFGAFTAERERGTLRLAAAQGVPLATLATGKALGLAGALSALLVPSALAGAGALLLAASPAVSAGDLLARSLALGAAYLLYFAIILAAALAVSARASSSRAALLTLLAGWVLCCLVVPRLAADIARRAHPVPDSFAFADGLAKELEVGPDGTSSPAKRADELQAATLKRYGVSRVENLPVSYEGVRLQAGEDWGYPIFDRRYGALWGAYGQQDRVGAWFGFLAPVIPLRAVSAGLCGTDRRAHERFARAAEAYRRLEIKMINDDILYHAKTGDTGYTAGRALWEKIPPFTYEAAPLPEILGEAVGDLGLLAGVAVVAWAVALGFARQTRVL